MFENSNIELKVIGDREFALVDSLVYKGRDNTFMVPAGFVTDFASVPAAIAWLIPSYGKYTLAAILHDYFCVALADAHRAGTELGVVQQPGGKTTLINSRDTDGIFRRVMRELEVPFVRRWLMWCGVRWGAVANPARRKGFHKDFCKVLLISVLAFPLVAPASLFVAIGLLIDKAVERIG